MKGKRAGVAAHSGKSTRGAAPAGFLTISKTEINRLKAKCGLDSGSMN
jgi:hypothetical protein